MKMTKKEEKLIRMGIEMSIICFINSFAETKDTLIEAIIEAIKDLEE